MAPLPRQRGRSASLTRIPNNILSIEFVMLLLSMAAFVGVDAGQHNTPFVEGEVPDGVVALRANNFRAAIEDPANPLWLLKFYAPWCVLIILSCPLLERGVISVFVPNSILTHPLRFFFRVSGAVTARSSPRCWNRRHRP